MKMTGWAITLGLSAAAGAVALMMTPKQSSARRLADKAACKVEGMMSDATNMLNKEMGI